MAKFLSSTTPKWSKQLTWLNQRCFSCDYDGQRNKAPLCKGRKLPQPERKCKPKEGSCFALIGACPTTKFPECSEMDIKPPMDLSCCSDSRLTESSCRKPDKKLQKQEEKKTFVSMWEICGIQNQCPEARERLDETHYKPTDKTKRIYTQTWESCAPVIRQRKVCCLNEMCMLPPLNKRPKTECPRTAKEQDVEQLKTNYNILKKCLQENLTHNSKQKGKSKCVKITMPCCRKVAKIIKCHKRRKVQCLKDCCPHPSFSECDRSQLNQELPSECRCSHFISQCDANQFSVRKQFFRRPPSLPAWPPKERPK